jgi:hypothetical protein
LFTVPTSQPTRLFTLLDQRRQELELLRWRDLADLAGVNEATIRTICAREGRPSMRQVKAERKLEAALGWAAGSLQAIRDGGEPTGIGTRDPFEDADDLEEAINRHPDLDEEAKRTLLNVYRAYRDKPLDVRFARLVRN